MRVRAPGRVNIIGEHTDYTGGFVLPCAIGYETRVEAFARDHASVVVHSLGDTRVFELAPPATRSHDWQDYVRGVIAELGRAGVALRGAELFVDGTLPRNAGLSSSASFEAAVALALLGVAGETMPPVALATLLQRAENEHTGTRCGVMDQFAVLNARAGAALFLDTRSLACDHVPVPPDVAIVVCNSMVKHHLAADGTFNTRRAECEESVARLRVRLPGLGDLRDLTLAELDASRDILPSPLFERCRHVVGENARVISAVEALRARDYPLLGSLMTASHESLRTDFAVSCVELDALVRIAGALPGVYGARLTGGGFGGCTVNIVAREHVDEFLARVGPAYERETGISAQTYAGTPVEGATVRHV